MDEAAVERTLIRIAHQIIEKNQGTADLCLIGIKTRGVPLAKRVAENIRNIDGSLIPVGSLDVSGFRDDLPTEARYNTGLTSIPFDFTGKTVVIVDDVICTGRTVRAAMDAIMSLGRPRRIQLFALADRGHSELPIKANFVGKNIPTAKNELVSVKLFEIDSETSVSILEEE